MINEKYFKSRFSFDPKRDKIWEIIAGYLQREIKEDSCVLDIGAGYCGFINNIKAREKHALDIFDIREYADDDILVHIQPCTNLENLRSFDVIFASNLFEHLIKDDFEKTLQGIKRILKDKGKLIILQPNFRYAYREYFDDYSHQLIFTDVSMCDVLKNNGFTIKKVIPKFIPFSLKSNLPKSPFLLRIYLALPVRPFAKQMLIVAELSE